MNGETCLVTCNKLINENIFPSVWKATPPCAILTIKHCLRAVFAKK